MRIMKVHRTHRKTPDRYLVHAYWENGAAKNQVLASLGTHGSPARVYERKFDQLLRLQGEVEFLEQYLRETGKLGA